jgi:hypothetical protein
VNGSVVWRLAHPNGQQVQCAVLRERGQWRLQRWLNEFVIGGEYFEDQTAAIHRAIEVRRELERRGFRDDV